MKKIFTLVFAAAALLTACDGNKPTPSEPIAPVAVTSVELNKTTLDLMNSAQETLVATVKPDNATNKSVIWSSSNVKVVTVDDAGKITAIAEGKTSVIATTKDGDKKATCVVTVTPYQAKITGFAVEQPTIEMSGGLNLSVNSIFTPKDATNREVVWVSADENIVTAKNVNGNCNLSPRNVGKTIVTGTTVDGGFKATIEVTVIPKKVERMMLDSTVRYVAIGDEVTLTSTVIPMNATVRDVSWTVENSSIATVTAFPVVPAFYDCPAKIKGIAKGTTDVTVKSKDGDFTAVCKVNVVSAVASISLDQATATVTEGKNITLAATILPADAMQGIVWTSSNEKVAVHLSDGEVRGKAAGTATITATTVQGAKVASCVLTVTK